MGDDARFPKCAFIPAVKKKNVLTFISKNKKKRKTLQDQHHGGAKFTPPCQHDYRRSCRLRLVLRGPGKLALERTTD